MNKFDFSNFFVYKYRYIIGYVVIGLLVVFSLIFSSLYLPGGLSEKEIESTVISSSIDFKNPESINVINLPYYLLQKASFKLFGVSLFTIKLPTTILAILSVVGLFLLLRQWFKTRIAVLASAIAIATGQFLFIAQTGSPEILNLFWPVWLMYFSSLISNEKKRKNIHIILFGVIAALSLYTPLSIYVLLVFGISAVAHPHLRFYIIKKMPKKKLIIGLVISALLLLPLVFYIVRTPDAILTFLGLSKSLPNLGDNLGQLYNQYLSFSKPGGSTVITPFFELGSFLIILIGIYRLIVTRSTAKSYTLAFWILILAPIVALNPNYISVTLLPLVILLASGLNWLLNRWYGLFPRNPYARIAGLIPVVILVSTLILFGASRYIFNYHYNPNIANSFSKDIRIIPNDTKILLVAPDEFEFYNSLVKYNGDFDITLKPVGDKFTSTKKASGSFEGYTIEKIITTSQKDDSDRFYLYTKTVN